MNLVNLRLLLFVTVTVVALSSCGGGGGGSGSGGGKVRKGTGTAIRVVHGAIDASPVSVIIGDKAVQSARYAEATVYEGVPQGPAVVRVERANSPGVVAAEVANTFEKDTEYTLLISGRLATGDLRYTIIPDTTVRPPVGMGSVRVFHTYVGASEISVFAGATSLGKVSFGRATNFVDLPSGVHNIRFLNSSGGEIGSQTIELADQGEVSINFTGSAAFGARFAPQHLDLD